MPDYANPFVRLAQQHKYFKCPTCNSPASLCKSVVITIEHECSGCGRVFTEAQIEQAFADGLGYGGPTWSSPSVSDKNK